MNDLTQFLISHGGPVLFAIVFVEQAGLPLPSAPWLLTAGALSASGEFNPVLAIVLIALAAVLADSLWFYIGHRSGQRVLRLFCRLSLARNSCPGRTKRLFARHGLQALVAAKFLPGVGTVMPPLAGAMGMSTSRFLLFDSLGSLFYATFYIVAGFVFHNQLQQAMAITKQLGPRALLLALLLLAGYIAFKYVRRRTTIKRTTTQKTAGIRNADPSPATFPALAQRSWGEGELVRQVHSEGVGALGLPCVTLASLAPSQVAPATASPVSTISEL